MDSTAAATTGPLSKTIERTIEIDASPERVWAVLTDLPSHEKWNPFIRGISGDLKVGARLAIHVVPKGKKGMSFKPRVTAASPNRELAWLGSLGMPGLFDGAHSFVIGDLGGGRSSVTQAETFRGVLVPFFGKGLGGTAAGFEDMNRALKERCETPLP